MYVQNYVKILEMAKKPSKPGPKPGPKAEFRAYRLQIRLNLAERKAMEKAAGGGDVSTWAREILLAAATWNR